MLREALIDEKKGDSESLMSTGLLAGGRAGAAYGMIALLSWAAESAKRKPSPKGDILRNPALCCGCGFVGDMIADIRAFARLTKQFDQSPRLALRMMTLAKTVCSLR